MATQLQQRVQRTNTASDCTEYVLLYVPLWFTLKFNPVLRGPWRVSYIRD